MVRRSLIRRFCVSATTLWALVGLCPPISQAERVIYVDVAAAGPNNGTNWQDAYVDLRDALDDARVNGGCPCEIWVAAGLYKPDRGTGDRLMSFELLSDVALYGGFAGNEDCLDERSPADHPTILHGDLGDNDDPAFVPTSNCCYPRPGEFGCDDPICTDVVESADGACRRMGWQNFCAWEATFLCCDLCNAPRCDNSFNVLRATNVGSTGALDGFEIRGGEANGYPDKASYGGGIILENSSPRIEGCTFAENAALAGAAINSNFDNGGPRIHRCVFEKNLGYGGPTVYTHPLLSSAMVIRDCVFRKNGGTALGTNTVEPIENTDFIENMGRALSGGRVVKNCRFVRNQGSGIDSSGVYVVGCEFLGNTAINAGGAIYANGLTLVNSILHGNEASQAGAIMGGLGSMTIANSTITNNSARWVGGMWVGDRGATIRNSIFWGNSDDTGFTLQAQYATYSTASIYVDYSIVQGNSAVEPMFVDPLGPDGIIGTEDDDLRLLPGSPAINAGDPIATGLPPTDLDGHARVLCDRVDIGAYEFGIGDYDCDQTIDLTDFTGWVTCMRGPHSGPYDYDPGCEAFDFNADSAVDLLDFAALQAVWRAP